jgi:hypothetical protein
LAKEFLIKCKNCGCENIKPNYLHHSDEIILFCPECFTEELYEIDDYEMDESDWIDLNEE